MRDAAKQLEAEVVARGLPARQIDLLLYAIRHPEVLTIVENVRDLVTTLNADSDVPELKVAEEPED